MIFRDILFLPVAIPFHPKKIALKTNMRMICYKGINSASAFHKLAFLTQLTNLLF